MTEVGTKHAAMTCDPVQYLTNVGETHTLSEYDVAPAEKCFVRVWAVAGSTPTAETFNKLRVEHYTRSSEGIDALPRRSGEIRGHVHGRAFRVNKACRLHVTDHEDYVTMVSYMSMATMCRSAPPIHVPLVLALHRSFKDCLYEPGQFQLRYCDVHFLSLLY